jgi:hypothetical protein
MTATKSTVPASAYLLADHLDAALAAGEDIIAAGRRCQEASSKPGPGGALALRSAVELIRSLELALITRVLKAREWSQTLLRIDPRFRPTGILFTAGTAVLVDALAEFADASDADFNNGDGLTAYFRSRGVLDSEAPVASEAAGVAINERYLVAGRIDLGALLDLIAAYLDALEGHFTLFNGAESAGAAAFDNTQDPAGTAAAG